MLTSHFSGTPSHLKKATVEEATLTSASAGHVVLPAPTPLPAASFPRSTIAPPSPPPPPGVPRGRAAGQDSGFSE